MKKICINCNHIGNEIRTVYASIIIPAVLIFLGIGTFFNLHTFDNQIVGILVSATWLLSGIYFLVIFIDRPEQCPNCNKKRIMIPLDTPKAQELIKENNLSVPSESTEHTKAPST